MGKHRIFEIAKEFDTTSKVIIDILSRNDVHVKNHMSSVDDDVRKIVAKTFERKADKPSVKPNVSAKVAQHGTNISNEKAVRPVVTTNDRTIDKRKQYDNKNAVSGVGQIAQQRSNDRQSFKSNTPTNRFQGPNNNFQQRPIAERNPRQNTVSSGDAQKFQRSQYSPQHNASATGESRNVHTGGNFINHKQQNPHQSGSGTNRPMHQTSAGKPSSFGQQKINKGPQQGTKPAKQQSNDFNKKTPNKSRTESKGPIQGSYATKGSRPMHSQNRMGRSNKRPGMGPKTVPQKTVEVVKPSMVEIGETINVKVFADLIKREVSEVIKHLFMLGVMVTINQNIDFETAVLVGSEFNVEVVALPPEEDPTEIPEPEDDPAKRSTRPPVITVVGHVDHGNTS